MLALPIASVEAAVLFISIDEEGVVVPTPTLPVEVIRTALFKLSGICALPASFSADTTNTQLEPYMRRFVLVPSLIYSLAVGDVVPIPTLPDVSTTALNVLLVYIAKL